MRNRKKRWLIPIAPILIFAVLFFFYAADYYRADETALTALESTEAVLIKPTDYGWFFDGPSEDTALIFYPGAKVDERAYAPLLHAIAENGLDVALVKMPSRLAFFGPNAAAKVMAENTYAHWYISGHSLGGAVAANYAASHELAGVILLAAYPTKAVDEPMLIIHGSEDGVVNLKRISNAGQYGKVTEIVIPGGNHAGFGNYGAQKGDRAAGIESGEQQGKTVEIIIAWSLHGSYPFPSSLIAS